MNALLSKSKAQKVCDIFGMGNLETFKLIPSGMVNHSYKVRTDKGQFILRKLGYELNGYWSKQKKLEFIVLDSLHKNKFPYKTPEFLNSKKGEHIINLNGEMFEAYPRVPGRRLNKLDDKNLESVAKALAEYHNYSRRIRLSGEFKKKKDYSWIINDYEKMKEIKPRDKLDKLMLRNIDFFEDLLKKILKIDFGEDLLVAHGDFHKQNIVFNKEGISGIFDFEAVSYEPKIRDFIKIAKPGKSSYEKFIGFYKKYGKFSKNEESKILPYNLLNYCNSFWWYYSGMKKRPDLKYKNLLRVVSETKTCLSLWEEAR